MIKLSDLLSSSPRMSAKVQWTSLNRSLKLLWKPRVVSRFFTFDVYLKTKGWPLIPNINPFYMQNRTFQQSWWLQSIQKASHECSIARFWNVCNVLSGIIIANKLDSAKPYLACILVRSVRDSIIASSVCIPLAG